MSEVWLAKHEALAAPVIVKTLRRALREDDRQGAASRILSEARLMARVHSPRIVHALDAGLLPDTETPFLVQDYVDGIDFAELDRRRRASIGVGLPLWLVCLVMRETSLALRAAHQAGVIHRDMKPSNVFGAAETGILLGDFGIAVARGDTMPTESAGTLAFMAPEQFKNGEVGRFTDVWGAGATACDLRYGHKPFNSVGEILDENVRPALPPPTSPAEAYFQEIVRAMLTRDLRRRPSDMVGPLHHFTLLARALEPPTPVASRLDAGALLVGGMTLSIRVGDIAEATCDAIVSSANYELAMRTGVADALRRRGGDAIEDEARKHGEQPLGSCVRTGSGKLAAQHVFHAVAAWNEVSCVGRAFQRSLIMADERGCTTLAAPALGTGAARVGFEACATAMMTTLRWHSMLGGSRLREVTVWVDSEAKRRAFQDIAEEVFGLVEARQLGTVDLGLPVTDSTTTGEGATFIDPARSGSR